MRSLTPLALVLLLGCAQDGATAPQDPAAPIPAPGTAVAVDPHGDVPDLADPTPPSTTSGLRRMTLDELSATIAVVAGSDELGAPITWTVPIDGETLSAVDPAAYGGVLGQPDWISVTEEDPAPSALYLKFVKDMALSVCDRIVSADLARADGDAHTLWRHAPVDGTASDAQRLENASYLVLRFLGVDAVADDELVTSLLTLQAASTDAAEGWRSVCLALFEDPAFHLH